MSCVEESKTKDFKVKHVIIIGVDAMSPDGIINAETPILDNMMANGAYTLNARGVLPTSSSTNWASMISGSGPEQHGITSNGWERDDHTLPPVLTGLEGIFPTIFGETRQQRPDIEMGAIYTWGGFGRLIERSALSFDSTQKDDELTLEKATNYIKDKKPDFLFIHFDEVDHIGHSLGHKTPDFYKAVSHVDQQIGEIVQATKDAGIFNETAFIISADHGGIGFGHGGETIDEIEIPFILFGKGFKKGYIIKNKVYTYDNASTAAVLLGIEQPYAWIGKPVMSAFKGMPEPELKNQKVAIEAPVIYPKPNLYDSAGGLYINQEADVIIEAVENAEIRYTTDGSLPTKSSKLYSGAFKLTESTVVFAKAFLGNNMESNISRAFYRLVNSDSKNGINYKYYQSKSEWKFLPVFETLKPEKTGTTYEFRIDDINEIEGQYGIQYISNIQIDEAGDYRFYLNSDDGSKLYVNGSLIVDNDGGHGTIERMGSVSLKKGRHQIIVDYHNQAGGAWLDVFYKGPEIPKQIIPADKLFIE
ncbi:alkaline phosphatase family protein [Sabulilitoribacter arenilitoris]|uniref:Alkaline phosphatase family protein n=1 Tax=Wocania arenilitoris TaxID=2044858 RepID=A0AAE3ENN7_9FLAO|nr:alkaline phosphatase family protein [Wocania arenilitoris]MCF7568786.1 alkaline phosphatase family protein [Wocania arenilitoris]